MITKSIDIVYLLVNLLTLQNLFSLEQGLLFCTGETVKAPLELLRAWLHETQRVYGDRLLEEKDLEMLNKLQVDITKKIFEVSC